MRLVKSFWLALLVLVALGSSAFAQADKKPADAKPATSADAKPAASAEAPKAAEPAAGDAKPADAKPADAKPADAKPAAAPPGGDGATYVVRLRDLEQRVDELKEQIRRSHTRLSLLSDTILSGGVGGSRAEVKFTNDMSTAFRITRVLFVLDGAVQYNKTDDTGALAGQHEIPIYQGTIPPGDHTLQVLVGLRGHGYGVFSYLRGYKFEVKSSHSFTVTEGKTVELEAIAWEKGGVTTPLEQRPAIRYVERIRSGVTGGDKAKPASEGNKSGASGSFSIGGGN